MILSDVTSARSGKECELARGFRVGVDSIVARAIDAELLDPDRFRPEPEAGVLLFFLLPPPPLLAVCFLARRLARCCACCWRCASNNRLLAVPIPLSLLDSSPNNPLRLEGEPAK